MEGNLDTGATVSLVVRVAKRFPELLVGAHILQRYTVMIDQRARTIARCD